MLVIHYNALGYEVVWLLDMRRLVYNLVFRFNFNRGDDDDGGNIIGHLPTFKKKCISKT